MKLFNKRKYYSPWRYHRSRRTVKKLIFPGTKELVSARKKEADGRRGGDGTVLKEDIRSFAVGMFARGVAFGKYRGSSRTSIALGHLGRGAEGLRGGLPEPAARYKVTRNYICILFQFCRLFNCSNGRGYGQLPGKFS